MPGVKWVQQLLEIEQRESARRQLLQKHAHAIFEMLKTEVAQCVDQWNAARAGAVEPLMVEAGDFTITIGKAGDPAAVIHIVYNVTEARLRLPEGAAAIDLEDSPVTSPAAYKIQGRYTPFFTIQGRREQLGVPGLVEHLLKPVLFTPDIIAKVPPPPVRSSEMADRDAEKRRAAATQPLI